MLTPREATEAPTQRSRSPLSPTEVTELATVRLFLILSALLCSLRPGFCIVCDFAHARPIMLQHSTSWGERERVPPWEFNAPPVCLSIYIYIYIYIYYIYISYVRHFWSRGPRATRKRKPAHLKFKGHMHACCIILYVANASRAITTLIERLHMYSSSLITSSAG